MARFDRFDRDRDKLLADDLDPEPYAVGPTPGKLPATARLTPGAGVAPPPFDAAASWASVLQRKESGAGPRADAADAVAAASATSGAPLPDDLREKFEGSLGTDLAGVRIHTDAASADAAASVGARAYARGQDIHFAAGQFDPGSEAGQRLLAHEVAHTVQQAGGAAGLQHKLEVSQAGDAMELDADRAADAMVAGAPAMVAGGSPSDVQRAEDKAEEGPGEQKPITTKGGVRQDAQRGEAGKPGKPPATAGKPAAEPKASGYGDKGENSPRALAQAKAGALLEQVATTATAVGVRGLPMAAIGAGARNPGNPLGRAATGKAQAAESDDLSGGTPVTAATASPAGGLGVPAPQAPAAPIATPAPAPASAPSGPVIQRKIDPTCPESPGEMWTRHGESFAAGAVLPTLELVVDLPGLAPDLAQRATDGEQLMTSMSTLAAEIDAGLAQDRAAGTAIKDKDRDKLGLFQTNMTAAGKAFSEGAEAALDAKGLAMQIAGATLTKLEGEKVEETKAVREKAASDMDLATAGISKVLSVAVKCATGKWADAGVDAGKDLVGKVVDAVIKDYLLADKAKELEADLEKINTKLATQKQQLGLGFWAEGFDASVAGLNTQLASAESAIQSSYDSGRESLGHAYAALNDILNTTFDSKAMIAIQKYATEVGAAATDHGANCEDARDMLQDNATKIQSAKSIVSAQRSEYADEGRHSPFLPLMEDLRNWWIWLVNCDIWAKAQIGDLGVEIARVSGPHLRPVQEGIRQVLEIKQKVFNVGHIPR